MANTSQRPSAGQTGVQRQIALPLQKAVEIAYKNIRMRLSRSLLVTSGIVLALAFLMSILSSNAMLDGMRGWMSGFSQSEEYRELADRRRALDEQIEPLRETLRIAAADPGQLPQGQSQIDARALFGAEMTDLQRDVGALPGTPRQMQLALSVNPELVPTFREWLALQRERREVVRRLNGPEHLRVLMENAGVATTAQAIEDDRTQTRWLLGLALLVAFVGILNAMLMSVTERFREIGTMKCLGALDGFIVKLFLIESLFQGIIGTFLGILIGLGLSVLGTGVTYGEFTWINVPVTAILGSMLVCFLVGVGLTVAAAVYPAWQAARMQPIEAMRVET